MERSQTPKIIFVKFALCLSLMSFFYSQAWGQDIEWRGVVIHHSATPPNTTFESIRRYHIEERGWDDIGYHYVITTDGISYEGRGLGSSGAHARNPRPSRNRTHIGICLVGYDALTEAQYRSLEHLLDELTRRFDITKIERHHEKCPGPGFNWKKV